MEKKWQRNPADYGFHHELLPRYADIGPGRHISSVAMQDIFAEARMQFQMQALRLAPWFSDQTLLRPASLTNHTLASAGYPAPIQCGVKLVGKNSSVYRLETGLFQHGVCIGVQDCWMAAWRNGGRIGLTAEVRDCLPPAGAAHFPKERTSPGNSDDCSFHVDVSTRWGDLDADRCIGESAVACYVEQAKSQMISDLFASVGIEYGADALGLLAARVAIGFRRWGPVHEDIRLAVGVSRLGRTSFTLRAGVFQDAYCLAAADITLVCANPVKWTPVPIPARLRRKLQRWRGNAPETARLGDKES